MKILILIIYSLYFSSCSKSEEKKIVTAQINKKIDKVKILKKLKDEYSQIDTQFYLERYIEQVIKEGSKGLGFASGDMHGGYAIDEDIEKISHYVVTLSGKVCKKHEMAAKAQMYYTSNCGGCHGNDGKGLNGAFPDLTKPTMLGIQKRKEHLKYKIDKLLNDNSYHKK